MGAIMCRLAWGQVFASIPQRATNGGIQNPVIQFGADIRDLGEAKESIKLAYAPRQTTDVFHLSARSNNLVAF